MCVYVLYAQYLEYWIYKTSASHNGKVMFSTYVDARSLKRVTTKTIFCAACSSVIFLCGYCYCFICLLASLSIRPNILLIEFFAFFSLPSTLLPNILRHQYKNLIRPSFRNFDCRQNTPYVELRYQCVCVSIFVRIPFSLAIVIVVYVHFCIALCLICAYGGVRMRTSCFIPYIYFFVIPSSTPHAHTSRYKL